MGLLQQLCGVLSLAAIASGTIDNSNIIEIDDSNFNTLLNFKSDDVVQPYTPSMQYARQGNVALLVTGDATNSVRCRAAQVSFAALTDKFRERVSSISSIFSYDGSASETVTFAKAYQETSPDLVSILDVARVPTLFLFFSTGGFSVFNGVMSQTDEIASWMDRLINGPFDELKNVDELVALTEEPEDNIAVAFFADGATAATTDAQSTCVAFADHHEGCSGSGGGDMLRTGRAALKDFASVSRVLWRDLTIRFAVVESTRVAAELGIGLHGIAPQLMLFKERGKTPVSLPDMTIDKDVLTRSIRRYLLPPVVRLTEENLTQVFSSDFDYAVLFQHDMGSRQNDIEHAFVDVVRNIGRAVYGKTVFLLSNTDTPVTRRLFAELDPQAAKSTSTLEQTSKLYFFRLKDGIVSERYCFNSDKLSIPPMDDGDDIATRLGLSNDISEFIINASSRNMPTCKKSQPAPDMQTAPVYQLVASTFEKLVYNPKITVFVFYHAPWCGHSLNADLPFKEAAMALSGDESILFAKIDATRNDLPNNLVYSYPQFVMYPRSNKESAVVYDGELSSNAFMTFAAIFSDLP